MACFQLGEGVNSRCILALAAPAWYLGRESRLGGEEERRCGLLRADVSFLGIWHISLTVLKICCICFLIPILCWAQTLPDWSVNHEIKSRKIKSRQQDSYEEDNIKCSKSATL